MMRRVFFIVSFLSLLAIGLIYFIWPPVLYFLILLIPYIAVGIYDVYFTTHNVLRIYPVIGHFRYIFEFIRPEIQQYFVATNISGRPFYREVRDLVYRRAKGVVDTLPFGTLHDITKVGYELAYHSLLPKVIPQNTARVVVGGPHCKQPYNASRLNVSAMSFGSLSSNAIMAFNKGAQKGNFAHDTGEGGLTQYHLQGGDIIWEIGTGYFGCRTVDGGFDPEKFKEKACLDNVKMIEIKLSQGAKPSHGGILPAKKVSQEIAEIRGVDAFKDCISPPTHSEFSTPEGLLNFVARLRELCGKKPVGFKLCIGKRTEFMAICKAMLTTGITPDFITVDGAEGGTGAAPVEFVNRLGMPINEALVFVHSCLQGINLRDEIKIIASGKVATGFDMVTKIALGADMCNSARAMMFAVGCIQALRCNTNTCPTGVTTQEPARVKALDVEDKYKRVARYHAATIESFLELTGAMGLDHPDKLTPKHINRRMPDETTKTFDEFCYYLAPGELLSKKVHKSYAGDWEAASADTF